MDPQIGERNLVECDLATRCLEGGLTKKRTRLHFVIINGSICVSI